MKLTRPQRAALDLMAKAMLTWTPGEKPSNNYGAARRDVLVRLKREGLVDMFGVHPYGIWPVYGAILTSEGKRYTQ